MNKPKTRDKMNVISEHCQTYLLYYSLVKYATKTGQENLDLGTISKTYMQNHLH